MVRELRRDAGVTVGCRSFGGVRAAGVAVGCRSYGGVQELRWGARVTCSTDITHHALNGGTGQELPALHYNSNMFTQAFAPLECLRPALESSSTGST